MHIVFLVHEFPKKDAPAYGAGNYVANMALIMKKYGHKVSVITEAEKEKVINWKGIKVYCIRATRGFRDTGKQMHTYAKVRKNLWRSIWYNKKAADINKTDKVDIVQSVNTYGIALFRLRKIPYIVRLSSYPPLWAAAQKEQFDFSASLKIRRADHEIGLLAVKNADAVVSPSILIGKITQKRVHREIKVIESPIIIPDAGKLKLDEEGLSCDKYFVTYGALANRKCIRTVAEAVDRILEKYRDMKYVIIGDDKPLKYNGTYIKPSELFDSLVIHNKERFVYMGGISDRKRLFSIVKHAYACILPTRIDNLPNTCLESMALGKIVISSYKTSVEQLIRDGYNGFLAEVDNVQTLCRKVDDVMTLSDTDKRNMEKRAQNRVKDLTPEKVYEKMIKLYEATINQKKGQQQ